MAVLGPAGVVDDDQVVAVRVHLTGSRLEHLVGEAGGGGRGVGRGSQVLGRRRPLGRLRRLGGHLLAPLLGALLGPILRKSGSRNHQEGRCDENEGKSENGDCVVSVHGAA